MDGTQLLLCVAMAVRGRPASSKPQEVVRRAAASAGVDIPGHGDERENRVSGLGPLSGVAVGIGHRHDGRRVPMKVLDVSHPSEWTGAEWAADVIPHLVYGVVTATAL